MGGTKNILILFLIIDHITLYVTNKASKQPTNLSEKRERQKEEWKRRLTNTRKKGRKRERPTNCPSCQVFELSPDMTVSNTNTIVKS